jgi:hypothetical protein
MITLLIDTNLNQDLPTNGQAAPPIYQLSKYY